MFFILSKIFWVFMQPLNLLCALGLVGWVLKLRRNLVFGQKLMNAALITIFVIGIIPIGPFLITWLEGQYSKPHALPPQIDGIIVLGGALEPAMSAKAGQLVANDQIERFFCFVDLAQKHPNAKLVSSGGNGDILNPDVNEADDAKTFFALTTLYNKKIVYEDQSRNTYENVLFSQNLVKPKQDETWVVITSAFHMPRTMGVFKKIGWNVTPYQCDIKTNGVFDAFLKLPNIALNFSLLNLSIKEIIGSIVYYITGKSAFIIPPPRITS